MQGQDYKQYKSIPVPSMVRILFTIYPNPHELNHAISLLGAYPEEIIKNKEREVDSGIIKVKNWKYK